MQGTKLQKFLPPFLSILVLNCSCIHSPLQGAKLQKELREDDSAIQELEALLEEEQKIYQQVFTQRQAEVDTMEVHSSWYRVVKMVFVSTIIF